MQPQSLGQQLSNVEAIPLARWIHYSQKLRSTNVKLDSIRKPRMEIVSLSLFEGSFSIFVLSLGSFRSLFDVFTVVTGIHEAAFAFHSYTPL